MSVCAKNCINAAYHILWKAIVKIIYDDLYRDTRYSIQDGDHIEQFSLILLISVQL